MVLCFDNWRQWSFRKQILTGFGLSAGATLMLLGAVSAIAYISIAGKVQDDSEAALFDQIRENMRVTMDEGADLLEQLFAQHETGMLFVLARGAEALLNPASINLADITSHYEGDMTSPVTDARHSTRAVSLTHSTIYYPADRNVPKPTPQTAEVTRTAHLDSYFPAMYKANTNVVATYIGLEATSFFRHFPGRNNDVDPNELYDPRKRGWYISAFGSVSDPAQTIHTLPYRDFHDKGWMITLAEPVRDASGNAIGVVGVDLLIERLQELVKRIKFKTEGKATLFDITTGHVVSDRSWSPSPTEDADLLRYSDLSGPRISSSAWFKMERDSVASQVVTLETDNHMLSAQRVSSERYLLVLSVSIAEVREPLEVVIEESDETRDTSVTVIVVVFFVVAAVIFLLILWTAAGLSSPIERMCEESDRVVRRVGNKGPITQGAQQLPRGAGACDEVAALRQSYNEMIDEVKRREEEKMKPRANQFSGGHNIWNDQLHVPGAGGGAMYPASAPPLYDETRVINSNSQRRNSHTLIPSEKFVHSRSGDGGSSSFQNKIADIHVSVGSSKSSTAWSSKQNLAAAVSSGATSASGVAPPPSYGGSVSSGQGGAGAAAAPPSYEAATSSAVASDTLLAKPPSSGRARSPSVSPRQGSRRNSVSPNDE